MIFAAFFVFFPPFFRSPAGATTVTKYVPARPCETVKEVKGQATVGTYADALATYRSRLAFFFESSSYLLAAWRSIFSRFTLKRKYKSQGHWKSIEIIGRTLFFCFHIVEIHFVYIDASMCVHVQRHRRVQGWRKKKIFAHHRCSSGKIDLPLRRFIHCSRRQKNFRSGTLDRLWLKARIFHIL